MRTLTITLAAALLAAGCASTPWNPKPTLDYTWLSTEALKSKVFECLLWEQGAVLYRVSEHEVTDGHEWQGDRSVRRTRTETRLRPTDRPSGRGWRLRNAQKQFRHQCGWFRHELSARPPV